MCVFTVRKVCFHSREGVCSQKGMCVFTERNVCVRRKECVCSQKRMCVFTERNVCVHRHILSDNKMTLFLVASKVPRYKLYETIRMLKTCFRIGWHVPYEKSNLRTISEVMLLRILLTILQKFCTFSCARPVIGQTEPMFTHI
jgi:hypothetical protein